MRVVFSLLLLIGYTCKTARGQNTDVYPTSFLPFTPVQGYYHPALAHRNNLGRFEISAGSEAGAAATTLPMQFAFKFLFGGDITTEIKDRASEQLNETNRAGFDLSNYLWFSTTPVTGDSTRLRLHLGVGTHNHRSFAYTQDLFRIAFYGNASYADRLAVFDNSQYQGANWVSYKAGISQLFQAGESTLSAAVTVGFLQGLGGDQLILEEGSLYTSGDGTYLDLNYLFYFNTTGSKATKIADPRGSAIAADVYLSWQSADATWQVNAALTDAGVFTWRDDKNALYSGDTSSRYEGIDVTNLILSGQQAAGGNEDLLLSYVSLDSTSGSFSTPVPGRSDIQVNKWVRDWDTQFTAGVQYRFSPAYTPLIYAGAQKRLGESKSVAGVIINAGGYGSFGLGASYGRQLSNHWQIMASSPSLLGFVVPGMFHTAAVQLGVRAAW